MSVVDRCRVVCGEVCLTIALRSMPCEHLLSGAHAGGRVEFLCHDINVHVPHHVSSKIPWYNLRAATDSLRSKWGQVRMPARHHPRAP